jgi:hypothetical protein
MDETRNMVKWEKRERRKQRERRKRRERGKQIEIRN